ncbi:MAG: hypothetical protein M3Y33_18480, partial [Actinomycetota bacterium]|nr:hypothetical protein [Actinomycetota bacterium]
WDARLTAAVDAGAAVAYANDLHQGENLPTTPAIPAAIITELGYLSPPGITHLYIDDFWKQLGTDLGALAYLPDVIVEHMHPAAGKADWDAQWVTNNSSAQYGADQGAWQRFRDGRWPADLARLQAVRGG